MARIDEYASLRNFLLLLGVCVVFKYALFVPVSKRIGADTPAYRTFDVRCSGYTLEEAIGVLHYYGTEGRRVYRLLESTVDLVFPLIYSVMLAIAIAGGVRVTTPALRPLIYVPFAGALFDIAENISVIMMINRFPDVRGIVPIASLFTRTKCALLLVSMVLAALSGLALLVKRIRNDER